MGTVVELLLVRVSGVFGAELVPLQLLCERPGRRLAVNTAPRVCALDRGHCLSFFLLLLQLVLLDVKEVLLQHLDRFLNVV